MSLKLKQFMKNDTVLAVACVLAVLSALVIPPDLSYMDYIDWNTLLLLFSLMAVMAGFQSLGFFKRIGSSLLSRLHATRSVLFVLVFLPFFFSMLITNDVALITFVPFAIIVLKLADCEALLVPTVVLQTIAANLGSMMTPMGNPQNLYLYARSGMDFGSFLMLMLPYTAVSALCLLVCIFFLKNKKIQPPTLELDAPHPNGRFLTICYTLAFLLCLLSVAKILPPIVPAILIACYLFAFDRSIFSRVDYALLGTFIAFFVFIGNMGRIPWFSALLNQVLTGHETIASVLASQVISNVPAALLLSGFTDKWAALIIGTNLGGLGTLIASMASLISYKQITTNYPEKKGRYFLWFTIGNLAFFLILLGTYFLL